MRVRCHASGLSTQGHVDQNRVVADGRRFAFDGVTSSSVPTLTAATATTPIGVADAAGAADIDWQEAALRAMDALNEQAEEEYRKRVMRSREVA